MKPWRIWTAQYKKSAFLEKMNCQVGWNLAVRSNRSLARERTPFATYSGCLQQHYFPGMYSYLPSTLNFCTRLVTVWPIFIAIMMGNYFWSRPLHSQQLRTLFEMGIHFTESMKTCVLLWNKTLQMKDGSSPTPRTGYYPRTLRLFALYWYVSRQGVDTYWLWSRI